MDDGWHGEDHMLFDALERWKRTTRKRCTLPRGFASRESLWDHSLLGTTADIYIFIHIYIYTCEPMSPCTSLYRVQPIPSRPFSFRTVGSKLGHFFAQHLGFFKVESTQLVDQMLCFQIYWEPTIFGEIHIRHW